jgi:hypothetical protein
VTVTADFEKLGVFYLGRVWDPASGKRTDEPLLYDSRDLVTHAVCVGMTGSGKTGLCVDLIEEAALDGVPALLIDPKGDLANLLLTFPELRPEDFRPWINEDDARRRGVAADAFAAEQAAAWRKGLADWGQAGDRIRRLREAAEFAVYTPGSESGRPLSILASFAAPSEALRGDADLYRQRLLTAATSLLGLLGIEADPIRSREHILLTHLLDHRWRAGKDVDLAELVGLVQSPPLDKVGVMDLDSFYPSRDRQDLALALNGLLASPSFAAWTRGEPLDVARLLVGAGGKPRVAILSIAHLGDGERMFFVSLLLSQVIAWMRAQTGTTSLRAILYMDEVLGFLPPVANPPSKAPFLLLLKQARAFGLGVVVATQNPVDLDYKALSNAGTWFLGRLQTERDKERVLDGLESAAGGGVDRAQIDRWLSGLGKRVFVMQNVHEQEPVTFETRWAMSYLRGPLTLQQLQKLIGSRPSAPARAAVSSGGARPLVESGIEQVYLPAPGGGAVTYRPAIWGAAAVDRDGHVESVRWLAPVRDGVVAVDWSEAEAVAIDTADLEPRPVDGASWLPLPAAANRPASYARWKKDLVDHLTQTAGKTVWRSPDLRLESAPGESEDGFRARLAHAARERRDERIEEVRRKLGAKAATIDERLRRAEAAVERERAQASNEKIQAAVTIGSSIVGALFGRRRFSASRASTAARGVGRAFGQSGDVERAEETVEALRTQRAALEAELAAEVAAIGEQLDASRLRLEEKTVRPKKSGVTVERVALAWVPVED